MADQEIVLNADTTANQLVDRFPKLLDYFDELGVDDCCRELPLRTIASHLNLSLESLSAEIQHAVKG